MSERRGWRAAAPQRPAGTKSAEATSVLSFCRESHRRRRPHRSRVTEVGVFTRLGAVTRCGTVVSRTVPHPRCPPVARPTAVDGDSALDRSGARADARPGTRDAVSDLYSTVPGSFSAAQPALRKRLLDGRVRCRPAAMWSRPFEAASPACQSHRGPRVETTTENPFISSPDVSTLGVSSYSVVELSLIV